MVTIKELFGAINYKTGQVHHREEEKADSAAFILFSQDILSAYPNVKMDLILDNSWIHLAAELQLFFKGASASAACFSTPSQPKL